MCLCQVTEDEICKMIMSLNYGAADMMKFIQQFWTFLNSLYSPLTHLCNLFISRVFSSRIHGGKCHTSKSDDPCAFNHYQPVSLLSVLLKVLEKVVMNYCLITTLISIWYTFSVSIWFKKNASLRMPFMVLMDKLIKSADIGECVIKVYLDFSWDYKRGTRNSAAGSWIISPVLCAPAWCCTQGAH